MATFTYSERIEPQYVRHLKAQFSFTNSLTNEALLIRLLVGTLRITNVYSTDSFDQLNNYSILGKPQNSPVSSKAITTCLTNHKIQEICDYLDKTKYLNKDFFLHLLEEISSYFYKKTKTSHTICFLHLYRSLEYISYSFPLIYASISREYHGSFMKMKNFFDSSKNELLFFDEFTKKLLDSSLLETPLIFNFNTLSQEVNRNHFKIIKAILTSENIDSEVANVSITTTYQHLLKLSIDLRNRYFHFAMGGQRNIRSTEIIESDIFFQLINEELLNWISIIYFEILSASIDK
ncbi:hypothetical protein [Flavobacterium sp. KACC 22761]|uniref:hypothetical protein n=1 Tax=Flavobacterium sp. KACC 22761 TaxID=3092665 RepID=UPI002A74FDD7|nr:hypothetical protein [Flavobacterium sp. KACC 22761]WPO78511.1 hypothetical protein SCB73_19810 [Flavobacterium sp. KACC 22761]